MPIDAERGVPGAGMVTSAHMAFLAQAKKDQVDEGPGRLGSGIPPRPGYSSLDEWLDSGGSAESFLGPTLASLGERSVKNVLSDDQAQEETP